MLMSNVQKLGLRLVLLLFPRPAPVPNPVPVPVPNVERFRHKCMHTVRVSHAASSLNPATPLAITFQTTTDVVVVVVVPS